MQTSRNKQILHKILERKAENWPCEEKNWFSQDYTKLRQTWRSNIGKRETRILLALYEINQAFESPRLQAQQANQWADQAQRDEIILYGELEMMNRLFREHQAKYCQEIEVLRKTCCEEAGRARQARIDELYCIKRGIL